MQAGRVPALACAVLVAVAGQQQPRAHNDGTHCFERRFQRGQLVAGPQVGAGQGGEAGRRRVVAASGRVQQRVGVEAAWEGWGDSGWEIGLCLPADQQHCSSSSRLRRLCCNTLLH